MARYNSVQDASNAYFEAKKRGDAAGMQAANNAANEIRKANGEKAQYATGDIQGVANRHPGSALGQVMHAGSSFSGNSTAESGAASSGYKPMGGTFDYDKMFLSPENYEKVQAFKQGYAGAATAEEKAYFRNAAEAIRNESGYATLADGSGYIPGFAGDSFDEYLKNSGYLSAMDSVKAANDAYLQQLSMMSTQQQAAVNQGFDDARQQAWVQHMQSKKTLPQRMSASGMNGGLADSQQIALDATLQNNQAMLDTQRQSALQEVQAALAQSQMAAQQNYLGELAGLQQQAAAGYQNYKQNALDRFQQKQYTEKELQMQAAQQTWEQKYRLLQTLGYADPEIAKILGIAPGSTTNDADYRAAQLQMALMGF